ncbi:MAG: hypothetical protein HYT42_02540 [Candidatus Sungbacteria bacterium]|nr:hypothetical protein [Candidatus Sungbacteria bacterium]
MARAQGGSVGRPHLAYEVLDNPSNRRLLGEIRTKGDFIQTFLVPGKPAYVAGRDFSSREVIELIHRAEGVAVWSHPAVHFPETFEGLEVILRELLAFGLEGARSFGKIRPSSDGRIGLRARAARRRGSSRPGKYWRFYDLRFVDGRYFAET